MLGKLAARGRFQADETVVAMITGNGLKTLDDHPPKGWPEGIACELDPMVDALTELKAEETLLAAAQRKLAG